RTRLALWSAGNKPEPVSRLLEFWEGAMPPTADV
ncbi:blue light sensor protein, partial [Xanthomonas perforans]|nr:blue light sensor protein [Xanthomonas perforans]